MYLSQIPLIVLNRALPRRRLNPGDLKAVVEKYLICLLDPVRKAFEAPELKKIATEAYPPPVKAKVVKGNKITEVEEVSLVQDEELVSEGLNLRIDLGEDKSPAFISFYCQYLLCP